jgi:arylformamidase
MQLIGVDYLSVGSFRHGGRYVHKTLLSSGIWTIEGLNLSDVAPGEYNLICLLLRIAGGDGAPARAITESMVSN